MMKRKFLLLCTFALLSLCSFAQDSAAVAPSSAAFKFAYLSYEQALKSMPDYALVQQSLSELRVQYDAELKRVEGDFNMKYEEFLEGQRDFPETILRKRQTELKELLERNVAFKAEARQQLDKAEAEAMEPLKEKLATLVNKIGMENGFAFILNTDANATLFLHPEMGVDINELVGERLKGIKSIEKLSR